MNVFQIRHRAQIVLLLVLFALLSYMIYHQMTHRPVVGRQSTISIYRSLAEYGSSYAVAVMIEGHNGAPAVAYIACLRTDEDGMQTDMGQSMLVDPSRIGGNEAIEMDLPEAMHGSESIECRLDISAAIVTVYLDRRGLSLGGLR